MLSPKTSFPRTAKIALAVLVLMVLATAAYLILFQRAPSLTELLLENQPPLQIHITAPTQYATYPANAVIEIEAEIWGPDPLQAVELWIDGRLQPGAPASMSAGPPLETTWYWTPDHEGRYTLVVKAFTENGVSALSSAVNIDASSPVGAQLFVPVTTGDSAEETDSEGLSSAPAVQQETYPGAPVEAFLVYDIPATDTGETPPDVPNPQPGTADPARPFSRLGELRFWLDLRGGADAQPPAAPLLAFAQEGCDVVFSFQAEPGVDSVAIYRAGSGYAPPDRIALFYAEPGTTQQIRVPGTYGASTYYAAAISPGWEIPGDPVLVELNNPACAPPESGGLRIEGSHLLLEDEVNLLYFYFNTGTGPWERFPTEPQTFLTPVARTIDIESFLPLLNPEAVSTNAILDIWGWVGGDLRNLGQLSFTPGQTELFVCNHSGACREGLGWSTHTLIADDDNDRLRQLQWSSSSSSVTSGIWQVSSQPFPDTASLSPPGLVASGDAGAYSGAGAQTFWIDFSLLTLGAEGGVQPDVESAGAPPWLLEELEWEEPSPFRLVDETTLQIPYYIRVLPMSGNIPAGAPSTEAVVYLGPAAEQENPLVEPPPKLPDIYTVTIDSFTNLSAPYLPWGCVQILSLDEATLRQTAYGAFILPYLQEALNAGGAFCPQPYTGVGEPGPLESFVDFATGALGWVSDFYESLKEDIVNIVANVINTAIPGLCEGSAEEGSTCHQLLKRGLEAGLVALGIPPEIPNMDQLVNDGKAYLVAELAEELGPECGDYCQEKLEEALDEVIDMLAEQQVAQACANTELAHANGREPLCLPPGVEAIPHPGSSWQPAVVNVTISRPVDGDEVSPEDLSAYRLNLELNAVNESLAGRTLMVNTSICYNDRNLFECNPQALTITSAPSGPLFSGLQASIPPLQPGASLTLPLYVSPVEYYLPGHRDLIAAVGGGSLYDDWWTFFYGAELTISAEIECPDISYVEYNAYPWQVCGNGDVLETTMPDTIWE